jgi:hypothetical protein
MKKVTIVFASWKDLWDFQNHVRSDNFDIVQNSCELKGQFSNDEISFAVNVMKARLVEEGEVKMKNE